MGQHQESEKTKCEVMASLVSETVFVGCEIKPLVRVEACQDSRQIPPHSLSFTWYREKGFKCCVHDSKFATLQCLSCVQLKLLVKYSYYCSQECFRKAWKEHSECHRTAMKTLNGSRNGDQLGQKGLRSCGSWPDVSNFSFEESEDLVQREGKLWVKVGSSKTYVPSEDDAGCLLRMESIAFDSSTGNHLSPLQVLVTGPVAVLPSCPPRHLLQIRTTASNLYSKAQPADDVTFSVLSYNILCDFCAYSTRYPYCPTWALAWEYRRQKLLHEIMEYNADIICLQEVQNDHFENFFKPQLTKRGYSVMYKQKPNMLFRENRYISDGCATFYRSDLFKEIIKYELEFDKAALPFVEALEPGKRKEGMIHLMKGNVALVVILEVQRRGSYHNAFQSRICVANTHIYANESAPDVKLFQVAHLVHGLEKIYKSQVPILICGDFNSLPKSNPYEFILGRPIDVLSQKEKTDRFGIHQFLKLHHSIPLASAYPSLFCSEGIEEKQLKKMDHRNKEPIFTNLGATLSGTLDYIFYTVGRLTVEGLLEPLDPEATGHLPSDLWSSDHIALMASFRLSSSNWELPLPANPWKQTGLLCR